MQACSHCGSTDHADGACVERRASSMKLEARDSLNMSTRAHPASKPFRDCRSQLSLAMSQREDDPARVWLELVSIRENASKLPALAHDDAILHQEIERFRAKLEAEIFSLTQEVDDEVLAPLYAWVDLIRRRNRLDRGIIAARNSVKAARASRGDKSRAPRTEEETASQLEAAMKQQEWWAVSIPPRPSDIELAIWARDSWDAKRASLPEDPKVVQAAGAAARTWLGAVTPHRVLGKNEYVGSRAELILVPVLGGVAVIASVAALLGASSKSDASSSAHLSLVPVILAIIAWLAFGTAIGLGLALRRRMKREMDSAVAAVWYFKFFTDQAHAMEIEVGWLRALRDAFHARMTFDESKGEGKQIEELKKWRADLRDFVVEVAKQGEEAETAALKLAENSMMPPSLAIDHAR
jgi:hypothetical protein